MIIRLECLIVNTQKADDSIQNYGYGKSSNAQDFDEKYLKLKPTSQRVLMPSSASMTGAEGVYKQKDDLNVCMKTTLPASYMLQS